MNSISFHSYPFVVSLSCNLCLLVITLIYLPEFMSLTKPQIKKPYHRLSSDTLHPTLPLTQPHVVINRSCDQIWMNNNKLVLLAAFKVVCEGVGMEGRSGPSLCPTNH